MDATKRPLTIPPDISNYAEKHGIFDLHKVRAFTVLPGVFKLITLGFEDQCKSYSRLPSFLDTVGKVEVASAQPGRQARMHKGERRRWYPSSSDKEAWLRSKMRR